LKSKQTVWGELLGKWIFVFLLNYKILNLARGATGAADVEFQIHPEVGLNTHCVEINGKLVHLTFPSSLTIFIHFVHLIL
jgi:(p)ppGpp synthase/HD superfamily hydrolase